MNNVAIIAENKEDLKMIFSTMDTVYEGVYERLLKINQQKTLGPSLQVEQRHDNTWK